VDRPEKVIDLTGNSALPTPFVSHVERSEKVHVSVILVFYAVSLVDTSIFASFTAIGDVSLTIDANHPLAAKELIFYIGVAELARDRHGCSKLVWRRMPTLNHAPL